MKKLCNVFCGALEDLPGSKAKKKKPERLLGYILENEGSSVLGASPIQWTECQDILFSDHSLVRKSKFLLVNIWIFTDL